MRKTSKYRPAILAVGTAVPAYSAAQAQVGEWMAASLAAQPAQARIIRALCANSGIKTRYACIDDYNLPPEESRFSPGVAGERSPTTTERMAIYAQEAPPLGAQAARRSIEALALKEGKTPADITGQITHLIVASCTGFYAPGLDIALARELALPATVERSIIGFMGCSAVFNCWRLADYIVQANPQARVLVVSVELSSLHSQPSVTIDRLIGASLFADGASACLVGMPDEAAGDYFTFEGFHTSLKPDTGTEMAWQIGDHGFVLQLSPRVPDHLAQAAPAVLAELFGTVRPEFWAIHPGGSAIVDRLGKIFGCREEELAASRAVLRDYGNLSSATILFVLDEMRRQLTGQDQQDTEHGHGWQSSAANGNSNGNNKNDNRQPANRKVVDPKPAEGVVMAFGPGLVIEMARMIYVPPVDKRPVVQTGAGQLATTQSLAKQPAANQSAAGQTAQTFETIEL